MEQRSFEDRVAPRHAEEALRKSEERYRLLFNSINDGVFVHGLCADGRPGRIIEVNDVACERLGYTREELLRMSPLDFDDPAYAPLSPEAVAALRETRHAVWDGVHITKAGARIPVEISNHLFDMDGEPTVLSTTRDITERKKVEEHIRDLARFPDENPNPVMRISLDGSILYQNPSSRSLLASLAAEGRMPSDHLSEVLLAGSRGENGKIEIREGRNVFEVTTVPILSRGYINLYGRDVTEERSLSEKFLQAQKMEAVGRLAGGIAHDFNNLLTVITGYCELARDGLSEEDPVKAQVEEIARAAQHAATLTTQLLAFSRKQVLVPRVISLNDLVRGMANILSRLIGEDIELVTRLQPEAGDIKADPGKIEQVLMNLAANARDAMPEGGKLTIETSNRILDADSVPGQAGVKPGEYVRIVVSDTGCGMDRDVLSHVFEPFFTTKGQGKGTGLGLSTVYGIVRQSGGLITCDSEPGAGTTFTIHLPRTAEVRDRPVAPSVAGPGLLRGNETILLVEDEELVRCFTRTVLENNGYTVIEAAGGREALAAMESREREVSMLVTDVVMPHMSGRDLAQAVSRSHPTVKVLYVSGYSENVIIHQGVVDPGVDLIQKPFDIHALLGKVREILDRR